MFACDEKHSRGRERRDIPEQHIPFRLLCPTRQPPHFSLWFTARGEDRPNSDIDLLVEFEPDREPGLIALAGMELELSSRAEGRKVDLRADEDLSPYFRDEVLLNAKVLYSKYDDANA